MTAKASVDPNHCFEKVRLVVLDLDCFLYPYNKTFRNAILRSWREIQRKYGLPIFRRKIAQKLIEEAKQEANKNPEDALCRSISKLAESLENKGLPAPSLFGMLELYYGRRKAAQSGEKEEAIAVDQVVDPPYKDMIAMAFNLRLFQDRIRGKKVGLTPDELQRKIIEGGKGATRLWHKHMGTGFIQPDVELVSRIQQLTDAGVEVAVLTHSFRQGEGEAMEKLERLGLGGLIAEHKIFGLEEISPHRKGTSPEVFEKVLAVINSMRDPTDSILPSETIMAEDTIVHLQGAKKAGMQTVWVPRSHKGPPARTSSRLQKELASADYVYATPHQFLDELLRAHPATSSNRPQPEGAQGRSQYEPAWRQSTLRPPK